MGGLTATALPTPPRSLLDTGTEYASVLGTVSPGMPARRGARKAVRFVPALRGHVRPMSRPVLDSSLSLLGAGHAWLPDRWRRATGPPVRARLLGRHAVALRATATFWFRRAAATHGPGTAALAR
jgi:hypothetical protein